MQDGIKRTIEVPLGDRSYLIHIGRNIFQDIDAMTAYSGRHVAIVSHPGIWKLYGDKVFDALLKLGIIPVPCLIPAGERHKTWSQIGKLLRTWAEAGLDRGSAAIALGGGVVGDMTGFAASCYMRGIPFVQIPTTLLAQVDSSVGGKTGVDLPEGKNLAGAFHQPELVIADIDTLNTLPRRQMRSGMAEVLKYGYIQDVELANQFTSIGAGLLKSTHHEWPAIVARCCQIKSDVVQQDEREGGVRAMLNYGHTLGHSVEALMGLGHMLHGESIAVGMIYAAVLGEQIGLTELGTHQRIAHDMDLFGFNKSLPSQLYDQEIVQQMSRDKKSARGSVKFVFIDRVGSVSLPIVPVDSAQMLTAIRTHRELYGVS
ncbi:MAG: 3-dehydroquinate synthase [Armatimonadota bacterium]